jgi:hypothetical protein
MFLSEGAFSKKESSLNVVQSFLSEQSVGKRAKLSTTLKMRSLPKSDPSTVRVQNSI